MGSRTSADDLSQLLVRSTSECCGSQRPTELRKPPTTSQQMKRSCSRLMAFRSRNAAEAGTKPATSVGEKMKHGKLKERSTKQSLRPAEAGLRWIHQRIRSSVRAVR